MTSELKLTQQEDANHRQMGWAQHVRQRKHEVAMSLICSNSKAESDATKHRGTGRGKVSGKG